MPSTFTPNKGYELQATGENNGTWGIKLDAVESIIDLNFGGRFNANVAGNTNVTVSSAQAQNVRHILTGALTGNIQYQFPNNGSFYMVTNNTSGAFSLTLINVGGGAGIVLPQGQTITVFVNPDTPGIESISVSASNPGVLANLPTAAGTANAQTATFTPAPTLTAGQIVAYVASATNTAATTFAPNGLTAKNITKFGTLALQGGEIQAGMIVLIGYDGTQWQMLGTFDQNGTQVWGGTSGGSATVQTITLAQAPGSWQTGMQISWASGFAAGAGLTLNPNGLGAKTVLRWDGSAIATGDFASGAILNGIYNGTNVIVVNPLRGIGSALNMAKGAAVASAATTDIWSNEDGNVLHITGVATITSFGTAPQAGAWRLLIFDGAATITNNANINVPGNANYTTANTDVFLIIADTTTTVKMIGAPDSGVPFAQSAGAFRNWVINGAFQIWQRGAGGSASIAVAASTVAYTADRWYLATGANQASVVSQQSPGGGFRYSARVQRNSGQTGVGIMRFASPFDSDVIAALAGQTVSLTVNVSTGANWSPASGTIAVNLYCGTGAVAKRNATPYTGESNPITLSQNIAAGSGNTVFTGSGAVPSNTTQMEIQFSWTPVGTAGANDWFNVTTVQLEIGNVSTPFDISRLNFQNEWALCQRYYTKSFVYATAPAQNVGSNAGAAIFPAISAGATANRSMGFPYLTEMRAVPTTTLFNPAAANAQVRDITVPGDTTGTTTSIISAKVFNVLCTGNASTAVNNTLVVHYTADAEI